MKTPGPVLPGSGVVFIYQAEVNHHLHSANESVGAAGKFQKSNRPVRNSHGMGSDPSMKSPVLSHESGVYAMRHCGFVGGFYPAWRFHPMFYGPRSMKTESFYGDTKPLRIYKRRYKCSAVRRICLACLQVPIHPNDRNYDDRICKQCQAGEPRPSAVAGLPAAGRSSRSG